MCLGVCKGILVMQGAHAYAWVCVRVRLLRGRFFAFCLPRPLKFLGLHEALIDMSVISIVYKVHLNVSNDGNGSGSRFSISTEYRNGIFNELCGTQSILNS
jgi:hypothetical protein